MPRRPVGNFNRRRCQYPRVRSAKSIIHGAVTHGAWSARGRPLVMRWLIGLEHMVRQSPADGHMMNIVTVPSLATLPLTVKDLRFDPARDVLPVLTVAQSAYIPVTPSKTPWKTFNEFVAYATSSPGTLNHGATNSAIRLLSGALIRKVGLDIVSIPYRDSTAYLTAVMTGETHMAFSSDSAAIPKNDRVRTLAVSGAARRDAFPGAPTFAELGHAEIGGTAYSLNVAVGTPESALDRLIGAAIYALTQPDVKAQLAKMRMDIVGGSSDDAVAMLMNLTRSYNELATAIGIQPKTRQFAVARRKASRPCPTPRDCSL